MNPQVSRRDLARTVTRRLLDEPEQRGLWLRRLAAYLLEHGMANQADLLVNDIARELYDQTGMLTVELATARPLADELRDSLVELLRQQTEATGVAVHETVQPELLGGFVARTADAELDASVRSRLNRLASLA